jgi:hypothetical protein
LSDERGEGKTVLVVTVAKKSSGVRQLVEEGDGHVEVVADEVNGEKDPDDEEDTGKKNLQYVQLRPLPFNGAVSSRRRCCLVLSW